MAAQRKKLPKKWLDEIAPTARLTAAARTILEARSATVLYYIPLAAEQAHKNIEYVHQLRVATRRASAAIASLTDVLPPKRARKVDKRLRKIRRHCGRARDLDVMIQRLQAIDDPKLGMKAKQHLQKELRARRSAVQPDVQKGLRRTDPAELADQFDKLLRKTRWRGDGQEPDWKAAATTVLSRAASGVYAAGQPLEIPGSLEQRIEEIHQLRISGKRLRYTMEITIGAFGQPLRELYSFVEESQRLLGIINDHAVAIDFYSGWERNDPRTSQALQAIVEIERRGVQTELARFPDWWNPSHVGQFWRQWQEVVAPLPVQPTEPNEFDPRVKKKGA